MRWVPLPAGGLAPAKSQGSPIRPLDLLHVRAWLRDIDLGIVEVEPAVSDMTYDKTPRTKKLKNATKAA
jgi:hypothetical protein